MLERVGAVAIEGDGLAVRSLLARDPRLLGDEVVHGHLAAEGSSRVEGWAAGDGALAVVGEEDDGAVGEIEGRESGVGVRHVGEAREITGGLGNEEVLVGGESLVVEGDLELGLD